MNSQYGIHSRVASAWGGDTARFGDARRSAISHESSAPNRRKKLSARRLHLDDKDKRGEVHGLVRTLTEEGDNKVGYLLSPNGRLRITGEGHGSAESPSMSRWVLGDLHGIRHPAGGVDGNIPLPQKTWTCGNADIPFEGGTKV